jgi:predicted HAD superfamily Cof-like phosphohydrolase
MLQHKGIQDVTEMKVRSANGPAKNAHLQQLHDEIDKLALLVNEAKRQSDRIQAAADALGDTVFLNVGEEVLSSSGTDKRTRFRKTDS